MRQLSQTSETSCHFHYTDFSWLLVVRQTCAEFWFAKLEELYRIQYFHKLHKLSTGERRNIYRRKEDKEDTQR